METDCIAYEKTGQFSKLMLDYLDHSNNIKPFITEFPSPEALLKAADNRNFTQEKRQILFEAIIGQYEKADLKVPENLSELLKETTFTITTGHQLNLLTGPLYSIIKIACVINMAKKLSKAGKKQFVPVFWMATEDHDLEEIDHLFLKGERIKWDTDQTGAVGDMSTEGIERVIDRVKALLGITVDGSLLDTIRACYDGTDLASAHRNLIHNLFGKHQLIIVDGNDKNLKGLFADVIQSELQQSLSHARISEQNALLEASYKPQAYSRPVNFFYLSPGSRQRIEKTENGFVCADGSVSWTDDEIFQELNTHPERFSPNVLLRPLYQETILPNVAYIGGGGELAYWLQIKGVFEAYKTQFPVLILRNSLGLVRIKDLNRWKEMNFTVEELFHEQEKLMQRKARTHEHHFDLNEVQSKISNLLSSVKDRAGKIDSGLVASADAEQTRILKRLTRLEKKITRAVKRNMEDDLNRLKTIQARVLPGGKLAERKMNFLQYYSPTLIDELIEVCDPLETRMFQLISM